MTHMQNNIIIFRANNGDLSVQVCIEDETVWLTQAQLADLFTSSRTNITMHIKNIFGEGELHEISVCKDFLHTASDRKNYQVKHYSLELIIALGYRVKS